MHAAEMAMFVVDAVEGPQVMTTKLWREAETMRLSRSVFINHIDREHATSTLSWLRCTPASARVWAW